MPTIKRGGKTIHLPYPKGEKPPKPTKTTKKKG